ncbi:MAG TPA: OmpA family protein [Chthoniobacteraceae bacterium]|jgi:outer membrane protein OmpA-like peptidoglycan-associated protein|nr:OmpA family protein [Chthoniobacteraceae bacterium]
MKVTAKCHNYTGCVLAYRGENIEIDSGAALVCPECGKAVVLTKSSNSWMKTTLLLSGAVLAVGAVIALFVLPMIKGGGKKKIVPSTVEPATPPKTGPSDVKPGPTPPKTPVTKAEPAQPPPTAVVPQKLDLNVDQAENKAVKAEVLTRIDLIPNITPTNRDKLYGAVERARKMGKVVTIPFGSGGSSMSGGDIDILKSALESAEVTKLLDDPTAVFVILGYADSKGDEKKNLAISQARADSVLSIMKNRLNIKKTVMHAVGMGSSKLLDAESLEKNRIVEVWAVLP